jgi:hypothetical protein
MSDYTRTDVIAIIAGTLSTTEKKAGQIVNGLLVDSDYYVTKQDFTVNDIDFLHMTLRSVIADESRWVKDYKGLKTINLTNYFL